MARTQQKIASLEKVQKQELPQTAIFLSTSSVSLYPILMRTSWRTKAGKAAFDAFVGRQNISAEMKLLQFSQCVAGGTLKCIGSLGYSATAHEAENKRLERRFVGTRRHLVVSLEALDKFPPI